VTAAPGRYRGLSLWHDTLVASGLDDLAPRPPLDGDTTADVCIVGAGFTGLWTAYYLLAASPGLRVVLLESQIAGFGASGRNGGWCSALFPTSTHALVAKYGREPAFALRRAMNATVDEVGRAAAAEGVDCDWAKGGTVYLARDRVQRERLHAQVAADERLGGIDGLVALDAAAAAARVNASAVVGGLWNPHCARVHPGKLVRGLARAVERRGGVIREGTAATAIEPRAGTAAATVRTATGSVRAPWVIRATEAWTPTVPGAERDVVPVYSLMVATRPLPADFWASAGLASGETFNDGRHLVVYGQRTADDRLAFGGRGAPYHYGSRVRAHYDRDERVHVSLRRTLLSLFPALPPDAFTHAWGGPLGIPRDWHASVAADPETGLGRAGGYVGDGVGTTNLAGRTLADLVLGRDTELTRLPWVGHRSPRWEPEPLRWLEINAALRATAAADLEERLTGRSSLAARVVGHLTGH
jgi:glycine/D-amino acid oxidase-like deaminating enzyme